jgi:hypothetical protein
LRERERESIVLHISDLTNVKTSDIESALSLVMLHFEHAEVVDTTVNSTPVLRDTDVEEIVSPWHCYILRVRESLIPPQSGTTSSVRAMFNKRSLIGTLHSFDTPKSLVTP